MEYIKRHWALPQKKTLVLMAMDIGGKNTQEEDQIRVWAGPTAGPEASAVLEGILGRWSGLWLPAKGKGHWQQRLKKGIYYSYILTCSIVVSGFFSFFFPLLPQLLILFSTNKSILSFWEFFSIITLCISLIYFCLYIGLMWFCGGFSYFFNSLFS